MHYLDQEKPDLIWSSRYLIMLMMLIWSAMLSGKHA